MAPVEKGGFKFSGTIFFWLFAAGGLALSFIFLGLRLNTGSDGAWNQPGTLGISAVGMKIKLIPGQVTVLQSDDIITAVEGHSLEDWLENIFNPKFIRPEWQTGNKLDYTILRDGHELDISVTLISYPVKDVLLFNWSTLLFVLVSQLVISAVFILNPRESATRALFIWAWSLCHTYVWTLGFLVGDFTDSLSFITYQIATGFLWFIYWGAFLHFALAFPQTHYLVRKWPVLRYFTYVLPFLVSAFYLILKSPAINSLDWYSHWLESEWVTGVVVTLLWLVILLEGYWNRFSTGEKKKARWIFLSGLICGSLGLLFFLLPASIFNQSVIPGNLLGLVLIPFPICLAISVLQHQLFDIDIIIRKTLLYSSLTVILGFVYFTAIIILQYLFQRITGQSNQLAIVISTVGIASVANPVRKWVQQAIDRRFFRSRYTSEQALAAFVASARDEVDLSQLSHQLTTILFNSIQPMYLSIWLRKTTRTRSGKDKAWQMLQGQDEEKGELNV